MRRGFFYVPAAKNFGFLSLTLWSKTFVMATFRKFGSYFTLCVILSSCEFKCSVGNGAGEPDKPKTSSNKVVTKDGTILTNDISLDAHNIKVKKASLLFPDETQVPDGNSIGLNTKVWVYLYLEDGWKVKDKKVFVGASESLTTDTGDKVVDVDDLFKEYDQSGIDPEDAKIIRLAAIVKQENSDVKYYKVNFRVWDKNGDADITGHYRFYIKH